MSGRALALLVPALVLLIATPAWAEEPMTQRFTYGGSLDFFATGAAMAADGPDADSTNVDIALHPAITTITEADLPPGAKLRTAFLYWGGSIPNTDCGASIDDTVSFVAPGQAPAVVVADACYCSDAAAQSYDIQVCRAEVTSLIDGIDGLVGDYAVDDFAALIANGSTNNASFSVVLVYTAPQLPARRIAIYDGLLTMWDQSNPSELVVLDQIEIDDPPAGDLTWYGLEGDVGGAGNEGVDVVGKPGNLSLALTDGLNPVDNPFNHTINTTTPAQSDALGVDIDQFDISAALQAGDTSVETTYQGGGDKYWIAYNVIGVNVFAPSFGPNSSKTWMLHDDVDQSGGPSSGDVVRYTITLQNDGDGSGTINITDPMPAEVASWTLVDAGGGVDFSTLTTLDIQGIALAPGQEADILFDVTIADVVDGTMMVNIAHYDSPPDGDAGNLIAPPVVIGSLGGDGDGDPTGDGDGDGDGDPTGDGDGDPSTGDGDGSGTGTGTGTDGSGDSGSDSGDTGSGWTGTGGESSDGCSCRSTPGSASWGWMLLGLLFVPRRRRR